MENPRKNCSRKITCMYKASILYVLTSKAFDKVNGTKQFLNLLFLNEQIEYLLSCIVISQCMIVGNQHFLISFSLVLGQWRGYPFTITD